MVDLYENGKYRIVIIEEYEFTTALDRWSKQVQTTGSFIEEDNRSLQKMNYFLYVEN